MQGKDVGFAVLFRRGSLAVDNLVLEIGRRVLEVEGIGKAPWWHSQRVLCSSQPSCPGSLLMGS